ncbi:MAG: hypothetical protein AABX83_01430 [Nanoarchaeota archaeon]
MTLLDKYGEVAADSTFYMCFLDDINDSNSLRKILEKFEFHIPKKIHEEISKSKNWYKVSSHTNLNVFKKNSIDIGKALYPFFSKEQVEKGESDIIVLAYICSQTSKGDFYFILDDGKPRKFIEINCTDLLPYLRGTTTFVKICFDKYEIFNKQDCLKILDNISNSKFRVPKELITKLKKEIQNKNE